MTKSQKKFLLLSLFNFVKFAGIKYRKGQQQHGGNLWEKKDLITKAKEEVIDQWFYLDALEKQIMSKTIYKVNGKDLDE